MEKFYVLMTSYVDAAVYECPTGDRIESDVGYFLSFTEAKAEAKKLIKKKFSINDDDLIWEKDDGYGWESDYGNMYGYVVWCEVKVIELKVYDRN